MKSKKIIFSLMIFLLLFNCNSDNKDTDNNKTKSALNCFIENEKLFIFASFKKNDHWFHAGTIGFKNGSFTVFAESGGSIPQLINIEIQTEYIEFIIRYKWIGAELSAKKDKIYFSYYFYIKGNANDLYHELQKNKDIYEVDVTAIELKPEEVNNNIINSRAAKLCKISKETKVYNKPEFNSEVITELKKGGEIEVRAISEQYIKKDRITDYFYKVKTKDGKEGWVFGYYVDFPQNVKVNTDIEE